LATINLLTTCSNSKRKTSCPTLHLGNVKTTAHNLPDLSKAWINLVELTMTSSPGVLARELYKGGHWSLSKSASDSHQTELWVLSAGLGLLHQYDKIPAYQATFSPGHSDTIYVENSACSLRQQHQKWWQYLSEVKLPGQFHPRSLCDLMRGKPDEYFIIVGSKPYIDSIYIDLAKGISYLQSPEKQLLIITSGLTSMRELAPFVLRSQEKMRYWLKCNMVTLNIALASHILEDVKSNSNIDLGHIKDKYNQHSNSLDPIPKRERHKCTEKDVISYISDKLSITPKISSSKALRMFRDSGNSFEEKRFRCLFRQVKEMEK